jgi:hypothetical protein
VPIRRFIRRYGESSSLAAILPADGCATNAPAANALAPLRIAVKNADIDGEPP